MIDLKAPPAFLDPAIAAGAGQPLLPPRSAA